MTHKLTAQQVIAHLQLEPLIGEGGYFRQVYRSAHILAPYAHHTEPKPACTSILYLVTDAPLGFSALHRLPTDEIYHFCMGDPLEMLLLYPDGASRVVTLGQDLLNGQQLQVSVPSGVWQGSRLVDGGSFALVGATMAPGYTDDDYIGGERDALIAAYPHERERIIKLTRV